MLSLSDLDQIEAQLDSTVPYYVPELVSSLRAALAASTEREAALQRALDLSMAQFAEEQPTQAEIAALREENERLKVASDDYMRQAVADAITVQQVQTALTDTRQKIQALREDVSLTAVQQESDLYRQGCAAMARVVITKLDNLGLTADQQED